ncbi:MAG TPA: S8 family serine peptidase [Natronosporangium sp.]
MAPSTLRSFLRSFLAVFAAVGLLPAVPAAAQPQTPAETPVAGTDGFDLTLVTGDTVHVTVGPDGEPVATVSPAPRPDGTRASFFTHQRGGDLYVVPADVAELVPRRLDPALFNVTELAELGFTDAEQGTLPLILTYRPGVRPAARAVPSSGPVRQLESVHGLGIELDKQTDAAPIAEALQQLADLPATRTLTTGPFAGLEKIWLDRPIEAALDQSVPQIGAPAAWQQGYDGSGVTVAVLDSGIDAEHPDLADQVVAAQNFTESDTTDDRWGHGTHVASTIAGTGAASGGRYTGVAPGVDLINAKVLNDLGSGSTSMLIEAMEWAAQQGADILNLSLGVRGYYTDGTDPGSVAVNEIVDQYGVLVVIAAGNNGPNESTVTTPGTADKALTVGAVDRDGQIADFSSRGPRFGDRALKPDITAPGVGIVAARAGGGAIGQPVDEFYAAENGTSMATPHVVGAAALVAQARPDLSAAQLKALLMGTAAPNDELTVFEQGAGLVDVPAALGGTVVADPPSVSLGSHTFPHDEREPIEQTVTYTNLSDQPQILELDLAAENEAGEPAPAGSVTVSADTVELPAGGSATVTVRLDTTFPGYGQYGGALAARVAGGDEVIRTPIGYYKEPERYNLRVDAIARDGRPAFGRFSVFDVQDGSVNAIRNWGDSQDSSCTIEPWGANNCIRVPPGTYSISGIVFTMPAGLPSTQQPGRFDSYLNATLVAEPEITIDRTTTLTLDARDAVEVQIETPDHETARNLGAARHIRFIRTPEQGAPLQDGYHLIPGDLAEERLFLLPTDEVERGELVVSTQWQLAAPQITLDVAGDRLDAAYYDPYWFSDNSWQFPYLTGHHSLPVVDAGTATAAELAGRDLTGALALVRRSDAIPVAEQSNNAAAAGAALVAVYNDLPGSNSNPGGTGVRLQVPTVRLPHADGVELLERLADGPVTVAATGQPSSPYRYHLLYEEEGRIPAELTYVADTDQLAAVENEFHSLMSDEPTFTEAWYVRRPEDTFGLSFPMPMLGGVHTRTDYYVPYPHIRYFHSLATPEAAYNSLWAPAPQAQIQVNGEPRTYAPGERLRQVWFKAPVRAGVWPSEPVRRTDDTLSVLLSAFSDGAGNLAEGQTSWFENGFTTRFELYAGDERIAQSDSSNGQFQLPPGSDRLRIVYDVHNGSPWAYLSTHTRTVWTFGSGPTAPGETRIEPLLTVDYDVDVDMRNQLPPPAERRGPHTIELTVGHQPGAPEIPLRGEPSVAVSYDSGQSWRAIPNVRELSDGRFVVTLPPVAPRDGDGFLSLRIQAEDQAGNSFEQEIIRAYAVPAR